MLIRVPGMDRRVSSMESGRLRRTRQDSCRTETNVGTKGGYWK